MSDTSGREKIQARRIGKKKLVNEIKEINKKAKEDIRAARKEYGTARETARKELRVTPLGRINARKEALQKISDTKSATRQTKLSLTTE
jgi:hypothetical protein